MKRLICILLTVSAILSLCACGKQSEKENIAESEHFEEVSSTKASEMKLVKTVGAVHVTDDSNAQQPVIADMNLYNGYGVGTEPTSYAWINIDDTKLLKMDAQSHANLEASGRKLKISLDSGSMFFCILEDLGKNEAVEFATPSTSNMAMSVRGTTGVVEVVSNTETKVILLEGKVSGTVGGESFTLTTGEVAEVTANASGEASVKTRKIDYAEDVPDYAIREVQTNSGIEAKIQGNGGFTDYPEEMTDAAAYEIYGDVLACYRAALSGEEVERKSNHYTKYMEDISRVDAFGCSATSWEKPMYQGTKQGFVTEDMTALQNWKYAFYDLNNDGFPELYIADGALEDEGGIRDCWTTDGTGVFQAIEPSGFNKYLQLTSNGYIIQVVDNYTYTHMQYIVFAPENHGFADEPVSVLERPRTNYGEKISEHWRVKNSDGTITYYTTYNGYGYSNGYCYTLAPGESVDEEMLLAGEYPALDEDYEFEQFMEQYYPLIPDTSLNWQPLN